MRWINRIVAWLLTGSAIVASAADPTPAKAPVKVEYFWAEKNPIEGVTSPNSRPFGEAGDSIHPHLKPILTNQDIVKAEVQTLVFKGSTQAPEQFQVQFQLTDAALKRLAETCPTDVDGLLAAFVDGDHRGTSFYVKSRDESAFAPTWGYTLSKAKIDQIVASFDPAKAAASGAEPGSQPKKKVELRWVESKRIEGLTEDQGFQSTCDPDSIVYAHKKPALVLTAAEVTEVDLVNHDLSKNGLSSINYLVTIHLTKEAKDKLAAACGKDSERYITVVVDGKYSGLRRYWKGKPTREFPPDVCAETFQPDVGYYSSKAEAERLVEALK
jgi:hypothetical protein